MERECIIKFLKLILDGPKYLVPLSDGTPALSFATLASAPEKLLQVAFSLTIFSTTDFGSKVKLPNFIFCPVKIIILLSLCAGPKTEAGSRPIG